MGDEDNYRSSIDTAHIACPQSACSAIAVRPSCKANCYIHTITITNVLHVLYNIFGQTKLIINTALPKLMHVPREKYLGRMCPPSFVRLRAMQCDTTCPRYERENERSTQAIYNVQYVGNTHRSARAQTQTRKIRIRNDIPCHADGIIFSSRIK